MPVPSLYGQPRGGVSPAPDMVRRLLQPKQPYAPAPQAGRNPMASPGYAPQGGGPTGMVPQAGAPAQPPAAPPQPTYDDPYMESIYKAHSPQKYGGFLGEMGFNKMRGYQQYADPYYREMLDRWEAEGPVDYTSAAPIADQYNSNREQLQARLAALGQQGGTVAGAIGQSYDNQSRGVGEYLRQLIEARRKERLAELMQLRGFGQNLDMMTIQRQQQREDDPGFWGDLLGVVGSGVGAFAGGLGGGVGKKIGGG